MNTQNNASVINKTATSKTKAEAVLKAQAILTIEPHEGLPEGMTLSFGTEDADFQEMLSIVLASAMMGYSKAAKETLAAAFKHITEFPDAKMAIELGGVIEPIKPKEVSSPLAAKISALKGKPAVATSATPETPEPFKAQDIVSQLYPV